jgi:predicted DNA-binding protein
MTEHAPIKLPEEAHRMLDRAVEIAGGTPESNLEKAIEAYLEDLEDVRAAEEAMREQEKTGAKNISLDELSRRLALGD